MHVEALLEIEIEMCEQAFREDECAIETIRKIVNENLGPTLYLAGNMGGASPWLCSPTHSTPLTNPIFPCHTLSSFPPKTLTVLPCPLKILSTPTP